MVPARLDTRPVASGYRGAIRTHLNYAALPSRNLEVTLNRSSPPLFREHCLVGREIPRLPFRLSGSVVSAVAATD